MEADRTRCSECGGETELGVLLDVAEATVLKQTWMRGIPKKAWLGAGIKVKRDQCLTVDTYRCKACGYLKSYAL